MACGKSRFTKYRDDDEFDDDEYFGRGIGFYASNFSEVLNELSKRGILNVCDDKKRLSPSSSPDLSKCDPDESPPSEDNKVSEPIRVQITPEGRNKMESNTDLAYIFSVRVLDLKGRSECKIHGKIVLKDMFGKIHLFKRNKEDALTIGPMDTIPLAGPERATWCMEAFSVGVRLLEGENVLLEGWFYSLSESRTKHEKVYIDVFDDKKDGERGVFAVTWCIMEKAVIGQVEMKFMEKEDTGNVWGKISACIDGDADMTVVMFDKKCEESVDVSRGDPIPLSRKLLTVPCSSCLVISANLRDSACIPLMMKAEYFGEYVETIVSDCGNLQVKVTLTPYNLSV